MAEISPLVGALGVTGGKISFVPGGRLLGSVSLLA
jgi:hypothetical protein